MPPPTEASSDVLIIGGGVMGCSVAYQLASAGVRVRVLERSVPGAEASSAAAGILGPGMEAHASGDGPALRLGLLSRELHARLDEELRAEHGLDTGFVRCGLMRVARGDEEVAQLDAHREAILPSGVEVERIAAPAIRELEPQLSHDIRAALHFPRAGQCRPRRMLRALSVAAELRGAVFQSDTVVREIRIEKGRVEGVVAGDRFLPARHVVVAAGSWTSLVPGLPIPRQTIYPVKGQVLVTDTRPPMLRRIVFSAGGYLVPRPDGELLVGATTERVGFERGVTLDGLAQLIDIAKAAVPELAFAPVRDHWAGFRPGTPDELPLIGPMHDGAEGLHLASGHYRNGILLAPVTGVLVADALLGRQTSGARPEDIAAVAPGRFDDKESA